MSNKNSRQSSPSTPPPHHAPSKLPKFLQKQSTRDRSKGLMDPSGSTSTSSIASGSSAPTSPELATAPTKTPRKGSKFLGIREKDREEKARRSPDIPADTNNTNSNNGNNTTAEMDDPPVIVEPLNIPRPRTRSERPAISTAELQAHAALYSSTSSASRIGDLPTRLSGWFANTFSTSTTDLSLPSLLSQTSASPKSKASALLTAAKHGKGHLDKAMRYLLDSDALPDKCSDPIWLLGVQHPGYEPSSSTPGTPNVLRADSPIPVPGFPGRRNSGSPPSFRSSTSSVASDMSQSQSSNSTRHPNNPAANWPPVFYIDFTSRIWLTYRSQFSTPIKDTRLADLCGDVCPEVANSPTTVKTRPWNWGAEKTWSSDTGWGCMLRTGQSLLANALVHMHLGRDWRRPPYPVQTADYATYVQIVTWFFDTPAPEAPFSVHRMALAGKELGTDVGQWFGPSVAAGAIKTLVNSFPECGLGVSVATDGTLFQSDVYAVSHGEVSSRSPRRIKATSWGDRPVLLLLGIRLGIEGVNPIYYDTIKLLYTFPQSVGIAGGRPSSSYYFVGSQADNLFYLDPHNTRPAIPLRQAPPPGQRESTPESDRDSFNYRRTRSPAHQRAPTSPSSVRTGSSTFSYHAPVSPSPLQQQISTSSTDSSINSKPPSSFHGRWRSASASQAGSPVVSSSDMDHRELNGISFGSGRDSGLDQAQEHYCSAYSAAELKTFHCERVRKMPLSGLDPSMLIGFLCRDEAEWWDFKRRVGELPKTIFSIQDEPPTWPSGSDDDDMGLESISEPDDLDMDLEGEDAEGEQFFESYPGSASNSSAGATGGSERGKSEDNDTEEDPVDPVTPGPNSRFDIIEIDPRKDGESYDDDDDDLQFHPEDEGETFDDDIEDDWVEPSLPTPTPAGPLPPAAEEEEKDDPPPPPPPALTKSKSNGSTKKSKKGKKQIPVPVPIVRLPSQQTTEHYPFPVTPAEEPCTSPQPRERSRNSSNKGKRMHTARARDGGRTQSGGVKGILTDEWGTPSEGPGLP